jgi:hypothetical protein
MRSIKDIFRSYGITNEQGVHVNGTDKETNHHYGDAYEKILIRGIFVPDKIMPDLEWLTVESLRPEVKLMMEIGVADGSSLLAWSEIFPNALCVGMDIHHSDKAHGNRIEFHIGDQRSKEDCERVARGRQFDVIVEDATHHLPNTLLTLYWMWPFIRKGGLYIVEEWDGVDRTRIKALWPNAEIVDTKGPFGGVEPLVVFRKS